MRKNVRNAKMSSPSAFTLIELLVVVAIISILSSIAVPNFMDAQVRAKVSRMKNDMRTMSVGIETYFIDNQRYPYRHNTQARINPNYNPAETNPISPSYGEYLSMPEIPDKTSRTNPHVQASQISRLTTPIAYLSTLYPDIFDRINSGPDNLLDYWDETQVAWFINGHPNLVMPDATSISYRVKRPRDVGYMLVCVGPDGYLGVRTSGYMGWPSVSELNYTMYKSYDPTNGTVSSGNLYLAPLMGGLDGTGRKLYERTHYPGCLTDF